jgi:hypothetical protein
MLGILCKDYLLFVLAAVAALTAQQFAFLKVVQVAPALVAVAQAAVFLLALNPGVTVLAGLALFALLFPCSMALFRREARLS